MKHLPVRRAPSRPWSTTRRTGAVSLTVATLLAGLHACAPRAGDSRPAPVAEGTDARPESPAVEAAFSPPGAAVLPGWPRTPPTRPASTRPAARPVRAEVGKAATPAPLVTIDLRDATRGELWSALAEQTGYVFRTGPPDLLTERRFPTVVHDFAARDESFWSVFRRLCLQTGLRPVQVYDPPVEPGKPPPPPRPRHEILLNPADRGGSVWGFWGDEPVSDDGPVLFAASAVMRQDTIDQTDPDSAPRSWCRLMLIAMPEPKLDAVPVDGSVTLTEAVDDTGRSLIPANAAALPVGLTASRNRYAARGPWPQQWSVEARLEPWDEDARVLRRVRGTARFAVQSRAVRLEVPDVLDVAGVEVTDNPAYRIVLHEVRVPPRDTSTTYSVRADLVRETATDDEWKAALASFPNWVQRIDLLDAEGRPLAKPGGGTGMNRPEDRWLSASQTFSATDAARRPAKLVWVLPTSAETIEAPFEFTDLPLP